MTSKERTTTTFRGGKPERVPVVARMWKFLRKYYADIDPSRRIFKAAEEFNLDIWDYGTVFPLPCFSPGAKQWRKDVDVHLREEKKDELTYIHRTITTPAGELHDVKMQAPAGAVYGSSPGPEIIEPLIKHVKKDLDKIRYMMADVSLFDMQKYKDRLQEVGDSGVVVADIYSPLDCRVEDTMKQVDFLTLYYDDKSAFKELLTIGQQSCLDEIEAFLKAGAEVVNVWWFYASISAGWSPRIFEECFLPMIKEQVDLTHRHNAVYIYYDDGKVQETFPFIVQSGADTVMTLLPAPMGNIDPIEVKKEYGDKIALMGGFDGVNEIERGTPESIDAVAKKRLSFLKENGGYIFDASCSLTYETDLENVRAFCKAGHTYGGY